jgi:hypothetical protein
MIALLDVEERAAIEVSIREHGVKLRQRYTADKLAESKYYRLVSKLSEWYVVNGEMPLIAEIAAEVSAPSVHTP